MKIGIVGAGITGSYLAYKLSKKYDVTVIEAKRKMGDKACSGLVSERVWGHIPKNKKLVRNEISEMVLHFKKKDVILDLHPKMLVINRDELDKYVMKLGKAKMMLNTPVKKLEYETGKKPVLVTNKRRLEFDYVIGADGAKSFIRKQLGGYDPKFSLGIFTYEKQKDKSHTADVWHLPNGFAWRIPRGGSVEYGVFEKPENAAREFKKFYKKKPGKIYSALIPNGYVNVAKKRVTLCGDAAGLAKPWSGGGIIWAMKSADILINNFPDFLKYDQELKEFFEPRIFFSRIISNTGKFFGKNLPFLTPKKVYFDSDWIF